jgi:hypothetical protein
MQIIQIVGLLVACAAALLGSMTAIDGGTKI